VPQDLLAIIRQYGGQMKETYGVPVEEIQEAIKHGVRKINIDTDIRLAMTGAVRKFLAENPEKFDAREWLKPAREAAYKICKQRYLEFGCEGAGRGGGSRSTPHTSRGLSAAVSRKRNSSPRRRCC
jgi:fructose-bisphosphate aldolase, class II